MPQKDKTWRELFAEGKCRAQYCQSKLVPHEMGGKAWRCTGCGRTWFIPKNILPKGKDREIKLLREEVERLQRLLRESSINPLTTKVTND